PAASGRRRTRRRACSAPSRSCGTTRRRRRRCRTPARARRPRPRARGRRSASTPSVHDDRPREQLLRHTGAVAGVPSLLWGAGLGPRLAPLSAWRAKPLVPVGDRPAVAHVVERVRGVSRVVVVNAHHRAEDVAAYARAEGLVVSRETELLGTAGAVSHARA